MKQASVPSSAPAAPGFAIPITLRFMDEARDPVPAQIRRVNTGFLLVGAAVALKPERRIEVTFLDRRIESQVVYCLPQSDDTFLLGLRMTHGNHQALRAEPRIPVELAAKLHVPDEELPFCGRVVNISASGLGLEIDCEVSSGEIAYVDLEIGIAFGEIRHCSKIGDRFRVGLKLDEFIPRENEVLAARRRGTSSPTPTGLARLLRKIT